MFRQSVLVVVGDAVPKSSSGKSLGRVVADSYTGPNAAVGAVNSISGRVVGDTDTTSHCPLGRSEVAATEGTSRQFGNGFRDESLKEKINSRTRERRSSNLVSNRSSSSTAEPYHSGGI